MPEYKHEVIQANADLPFTLNIFSQGVIESPPHWHNWLEILHIYGGTMRLVFRGKHYTLQTDDIIIANSEDVHATHTISLNDASIIQIPYQFLNIVIPDISRFPYIHFNTTTMKDAGREAAQTLSNTLFAMYDVYRGKQKGYVLKTNSLLFEALHFLYQNYADRQADAPHRSEKYLHRLGAVTGFIKKNYRNHITVNQMAETVHLNPEYFSRFFKKYIGMTAIEYLNLIRIQNIAADLVATDINVVDLAALHGCNDYKLLLRRFRSIYNCTPSQYRKNPPRSQPWPESSG